MGHNDLVSSRVRVARGETAAREIEAMLGGSGTVVRLVDPGKPIEIDEQVVPEDFTGVLVNTSGSTGTPKTVMLSRKALMTAAQAGIDRLGGPGEWANPLPGWYVAGLMTRVRAMIVGRSYTEVSPHLEGLQPARSRSYISLVPAQLHQTLSNAEIRQTLASYAAVLIGGARLDRVLRTHAEQSGITIVTTYGMSETCGGVVYDGIPLDGVMIDLIDGAASPLHQEEELSHSVRCRQIHVSDPQKREYDDTRSHVTTIVPTSAAYEGPNGQETTREGRILITTPTIFDGYLGDPELTATVRYGDSLLTHDRGRLTDNQLTILRRIDDVVQSGGKNVDLSQIQLLLDKEFPHQVACFAEPDPVWGSTVIVASAGPNLDEIWDKLQHHLDSAARPRGILRVDALPRTSSGKIDREQVAKMWRNRGERA